MRASLSAMIVLINTKTNERKQLTVRELFDMMADPDTAKRMAEVVEWVPCIGKSMAPPVIGYTYTPEE